MADVKISALTAATAALGADELPVNEAGTSKKVTVTQLQTFLAAAAGLNRVYVVTNQHDNSTTTLTSVTDLAQTCGIGTWVFKFFIRHQAGVTTTGIRFSVNHTGTVTAFVANIRYVDTTATASTAGASQAEVGAAAAVVGAFSARAKSTTGWGTTISTDVAGADMLTVIEGMMVVSVSGNIELYHGSEVGAITSVMTGTSLILTQIA